MFQDWSSRVSYTLRGAVVAALVALTVGVFNPGHLFGRGDDCEQKCLDAFGPCKPCTLPGWEGTNAEYFRCEETYCYYSCGSLCIIPPD